MATIADESAKAKARWDLTALFKGMDDPKIAQTWTLSNARADELASRLRGKINSPDLTAHTLAQAIRDVEQLSQELDKPAIYANLLFAVASDDPAVGAFLADQMERHTEVRVKLMFLELELQAVPDEVLAPIMADERLAPYRHFVDRVRSMRDHRLSEAEEVLLEEVANVGTRAWVRLFEELHANHNYTFVDPHSGEARVMTQSELLNLLYSPDRAMRVAAGDAFSAGLEQIERTVTFAYNTLLADKRLDDRLRRFDSPEAARHLANELDAPTVDLVTDLCRKNYGLVARYYRLKQQILGLPELTHIDRYAPLDEAEGKVNWDTAREIVLDSFRAFSPDVADRAQEFFDHDWIDAEPRTGKTGGAFCNYITPDKHPVVMMSYHGKMRDVETLAHELGHGVHASYSREQSYLNFHGTLPLAELASIFGEMLVFERLLEKASEHDQLAMIGEKIEGSFASVFRQVAMYSFERRAHRARREQGELSSAELSAIWQEELQMMFSDSVKLGDQHRKWWLYVGHFFFAPFYVYAYAFGELLALSLYQKAKTQGPEFADKYVALLKLGGSRTPKELMETVGVDLTSPEFWQAGIDALENLVSRFEQAWERVRDQKK